MNSPAPAKPLNGWADPLRFSPAKSESPAVVRFVTCTLAVLEREAHKLRQDPTDLVTRAIQPALWLLLFGQVFARTHAIPTGNWSYLEFLAPGILAQSVLFVAIFNGISVISERDLGIVHKFLASPSPRSALVLGKALSGGLRSLTQVVVVVGLATLLGVRFDLSFFHVAGVVALVVLGAAVFSTFSLLIASLVKTRERFMGIGQVMTMPLFFASSAIYPISLMPGWLQVVSRFNPLTYQVDGLRRLLLQGGDVSAGAIALDGGVLTIALCGLVALCARVYPNLVR